MFNLLQGNTANFGVEFLDATGALAIPASATITINYTSNASGNAAVATINMTLNQSFYTASWSSVPAALGIATYSVTAPGVPNPANSGTIRIIDP
jgi:hypothetical protein